MRPEIITASADSTHISSPAPMSEMHDNGNVEVHHIGEQAAVRANGASGTSDDDGASIMKQLWNGMLEDLIGRKKLA